MNTRERHRDHDENPGGGPAGGDGAGLDHLRQAGMRFLQAGGDAIDKALARGDSEAFLQANRQEGGQ